MKYLLLKFYLWFKHFGFRGLWMVSRRNANTLEILDLNSRRYGQIHIRNCRSDIEAVNTVLCFEAYKINPDLERCRTFVDLGGNIGMASKYLRTHVPDARIIALEPAAQNASLFTVNLEADIGNGAVSLLCAAIGPEDGIGYLDSPGSSRFDAFTVTSGTGASDGSEAVGIMSMKSVCAQCEKPIGVKMDIEGGEIEMLERRGNWLDEADYLMVEFHNDDLERRWCKQLGEEGWNTHKQFDTWHFSRVK